MSADAKVRGGSSPPYNAPSLLFANRFGQSAANASFAWGAYVASLPWLGINAVHWLSIGLNIGTVFYFGPFVAVGLAVHIPLALFLVWVERTIVRHRRAELPQ